ncbi:50S ribosomal protein L13 [Candidatus Azambacteria bacterium]|nr:50S ribosomal protein L13 [Candidatus Azambacteria bacterium]
MKDNIKKIDASGRSLGRVASEVAWYLMGKDNPNFERHNTDASNTVYVFNIDSLKTTGKKLDQKVYYKHSGRPGSLKTKTMGELMENDSTKVLTMAVNGMLPKNKLRPKMLKKLKVYGGEIK